jgi:hypothetical protein
LPLVAGITGSGGLDPYLLSAGFRTAMWVAATLAAAGGALSYLTIRDDSLAAGMSATSALHPARHLSCPLDAPPFRGLRRRG